MIVLKGGLEEPMGLPALALGERFTYRHYLKWPDEERWEIIDGVAYDMSPAPTGGHQALAFELGRQIGNFLLGKPCQAFAAPYDVRLAEEGESDEDASSVVQPDLVVVCDPKKLDRRGCKGAPDFVLEVLSPKTSAKDLGIKARLYERNGVREYWLLHPTDGVLMRYLLGEDKRFGPMKADPARGLVAVETLPGLEVDLDLAMQAAARAEGREWPEREAETGQETRI